MLRRNGNHSWRDLEQKFHKHRPPRRVFASRGGDRALTRRGSWLVRAIFPAVGSTAQAWLLRLPGLRDMPGPDVPRISEAQFNYLTKKTKSHVSQRQERSLESAGRGNPAALVSREKARKLLRSKKMEFMFRFE